jgi:DHA2 family multidrug resistance protein
MSETHPSGIPAGCRRAIIVAVFIAAYMQGVNVAIPNAALAHIQGSLSMADDEIGWLFTSYLAAGIVAIPITPWLAARYGRKAVFQTSIFIFAVGLVFDSLATNTIPLVIARVVQGAAGGALPPLCTVILLDVLSPARRAWINQALTVCLLLGISSGPGIGGWLSEYHGWPSIFYFSLPIAGFVFLVMALSLPEKKAPQKPSFDFFGFATFSLGVVGLQMVLDRGERLEWFDSTEIWVEAIAAVVGFYMFIVHVLTAKAHFFNNGLFRDRNFMFSTIMYFAVGFVLLPTLALTSPMLEELLNYPVDTTGYMTIPRGVTLVGALVVMVFVPARIDNRVLVIGGLAVATYATWRMLGYSPLMDWRAVVTTGLLQGVGLGISIPALARSAFATIDQKLLPEGAAIFNLTRLYGGTIGIALVQDFFYSNTQAMHLALAKGLTPYHASAHLAGPLAKKGLAALNDMVTGQVALVGIIGQFKVLLFAILIVSPLAMFLRQPRPALKLAEPVP